ncbi:MAG TPA: hypothetical protein VLQ91_12655 [Draconibacterium sp.]|nr:hypothetical protein [Draconibacterium sp.]
MSCYKIFRYYLLWFFLLACLNLQGQNNKEFNLNDVKETVYIDTDRDIYFAGEEILFSAEYFINQLKVTPLISNVIYLELINCTDNNPVIQKKYKLSDFNACGTLIIPTDIATGNYMLRVYTQYQRNFSYLNYGYHFLTILNSGDKTNFLNTGQISDSIDIVSEGNILLDKIENNVVFRIPSRLLANGNEYFITDETLNIIEKAEVSKDGFAQCEFIGNYSKPYYFHLIKSNGDTITAPFPEIQKAGVQSQTQWLENGINYSIQTNGITGNTQDLNYQIKVFTNDFNIVYNKNIILNSTSFETQISAEIFSEGINYIVLFDAKGNVEQINSVYNQSKKVGEIEIEIDKDRFKTREAVQVHIGLKDNLSVDFPVISVSVVKHKTKKGDHSFNPALYLNDALLLNDYLQDNYEIDNKLQKQIMMMFDKYLNRSFFEEKIKNAKIPTLEYIPETRDVTISGILRNKDTQLPVANHDIYASVLFNNPQLHICKSRENGGFIFSLNNVSGINDIFLCPESTDENEYEILITNSFSSEMPKTGEIPAFIDSSSSELIREAFINAQISQNFQRKPEKETPSRISKRSFNIDNNKTTTILADFVNLKNMEELFTEIVPTAKFKKSNGRYTFSVFDANGNIFSENPLVLLDKIPVFDPTKIMQLDISLIEKVEVINKTYILGANTFQGVIMLTSKTNNFAGIKIPESSVFIEYPTVEETNHIGRFSKKYLPAGERMPDFRTTLFWDSHIKLKAEGHDIDFMTSDSKGAYDIEIKGYASNGQIFYGKKQIFVQ